MEEEIKPIPGFSGYFVSNTGDVFSEKRGHRKQLSAGRGSHGYLQVRIYMNGYKKNKMIHHLVLETFDRPRPEGMIACHNDGNRTNNHIGNLRWGTYSENAFDAVQHGTSPGLKSKGENNGRAKLTETMVREIRLRLQGGESSISIAKVYNVSQSMISRIKTGNCWSYLDGKQEV